MAKASIARCYNCHKDMTIDMIIRGQKQLDVVNATSNFEGWVHCQGDPDLFLTKKIILAMEKKKYMEGVLDGIIVCDSCVRVQARKEGINI